MFHDKLHAARALIVVHRQLIRDVKVRSRLLPRHFGIECDRADPFLGAWYFKGQFQVAFPDDPVLQNSKSPVEHPARRNPAPETGTLNRLGEFQAEILRRQGAVAVKDWLQMTLVPIDV